MLNRTWCIAGADRILTTVFEDVTTEDCLIMLKSIENKKLVSYTYRSKSSWQINGNQESNDSNRHRMSLHAYRELLRLLDFQALEMLKDLKNN